MGNKGAGGTGRDELGGVKRGPNAVRRVAGAERENAGASDGLVPFDDFKKVQPSPFF